MQPTQSYSLSPAQLAILQAVARGALPKQVAAARGSSPRTIEVHLERARRKLSAVTTIHAVYLALKAGIIE